MNAQMNPFGGPDVMDKLKGNDMTKAYVDDPAFVAILEEIGKSPEALGKYIGDERVVKSLGVLIGGRVNGHDAGTRAAEPKPAPTLSPEEQKKKDAEAEKDKGNAAYKKREFTTAIEHYNKALELDPDQLSYLTNRAAVKLEMGDPDGAIADCQEVIKQNSERNLRTDFKIIARAYARIGNAYLKKDDLDSAIASYDKSLLEFHDDKVHVKLRETKKAKSKKEEEAYIDVEKSQEERKAGNELFKSGKFPEAIQRYTEAIQRNPADAAPYSNRAAAYMKLGEFPFALKDCDKCLELDPKYTKAYSRKGNIHFYMKEYHKAIEAYEKAIVLDPSNMDLKMELNRVKAAIRDSASSQDFDEDQVKKAMQDPEIQLILQDPGVNQVLKELSERPEYAQKALEDPVIADKVNKLIAAGVVRVSQR